MPTHITLQFWVWALFVLSWFVLLYQVSRHRDARKRIQLLQHNWKTSESSREEDQLELRAAKVTVARLETANQDLHDRLTRALGQLDRAVRDTTRCQNKLDAIYQALTK